MVFEHSTTLGQHGVRAQYYARATNHPLKQSTLNHDAFLFFAWDEAKSLVYDEAKLLVKQNCL